MRPSSERSSKAPSDFASAQKREETVQEFERNLEGDFSPQVKTEVSGVSWEDVLMTIAEDNTQAGREMTQEIEEEEIRDAADGKSHIRPHPRRPVRHRQ